MANISLGTLYFVFTVLGIVAPRLVNKMGPRWVELRLAQASLHDDSSPGCPWSLVARPTRWWLFSTFSLWKTTNLIRMIPRQRCLMRSVSLPSFWLVSVPLCCGLGKEYVKGLHYTIR